jgi:hypothetical protein
LHGNAPGTPGDVHQLVDLGERAVEHDGVRSFGRHRLVLA